MNTKLLRPLAASAILVAALGLSACGSDDKDKDAKDTTSQTPTATAEATEEAETPEAEPTEATEAPAEAGSDEALDKFVASQQEGLKGMADATGGMFTKISLTAEDGAAVYSYVVSDAIASAGGDALKGQEASYKSTAQPLLDAMKAQGIENPKVKFVFTSEAGKEIWSAEFK